MWDLATKQQTNGCLCTLHLSRVHCKYKLIRSSVKNFYGENFLTISGSGSSHLAVCVHRPLSSCVECKRTVHIFIIFFSRNFPMLIALPIPIVCQQKCMWVSVLLVSQTEFLCCFVHENLNCFARSDSYCVFPSFASYGHAWCIGIRGLRLHSLSCDPEIWIFHRIFVFERIYGRNNNRIERNRVPHSHMCAFVQLCRCNFLPVFRMHDIRSDNTNKNELNWN